jgi:hypothetical protein
LDVYIQAYLIFSRRNIGTLFTGKKYIEKFQGRIFLPLKNFKIGCSVRGTVIIGIELELLLSDLLKEKYLSHLGGFKNASRFLQFFFNPAIIYLPAD